MNYFYQGAWRMDWGLGNPNKTATLIALLMLATWGIALIWKKGFWPALVISTGLAWCLVQTYSRGGMLAFIVGAGILLCFVPRPWPKSRWIAVVVSLWILGGFVLFAKAHTRYGQGLFTEDQSIGNRLIIWKHVPEMMAAAPTGWGLGRAGDSYSQWYQPISTSTNYLNLINSHFTWMVEGGWILSVLYLFVWMSVLLFCWPSFPSRLKGLPFAVWIAFGVGACFSAVAESPWLWIVPLLGLVYVLVERFQMRTWPAKAGFIFSAATSAGVVAVLVLIGMATASLPIGASKGMVTIGKSPKETLVFADRKALGSFYGITFRKFLAQHPDQISDHTFVIAESSPEILRPEARDVVITGRFTQDGAIFSHLQPEQHLTLVNPLCLPDEAKMNGSANSKAVVYFGEYSQAPTRSSWAGQSGVTTIQIDGASDFVPSWAEAILMPPKI